MSLLSGFESSSTATQTTTTASDQAQIVQKGATVSQGGSFQFIKSQLAPQIRAAKGATVNYGLQPGDVSTLLDRITTATQSQIQAAQAPIIVSAPAPGAAPDANVPADGTAAAAAPGGTGLPTWIVPAAIGLGILLLFILRRK